MPEMLENRCADFCASAVLTVFNGPETAYGKSLESIPGATDGLCLRCGMCCDGTLFRYVELRPPDDRAALKRAGLEIRSFRRSTAGQSVVGQRFPQPCAALDPQCRCQVYADRPASCRATNLLRGIRSTKIPGGSAGNTPCQPDDFPRKCAAHVAG